MAVPLEDVGTQIFEIVYQFYLEGVLDLLFDIVDVPGSEFKKQDCKFTITT